MADYAISNVPRRVVYANSGVGPYAFTFEILSQTDISVYRGSTLLTLTTDYSVTINSNGTGSVTLVTAGSGDITIVGAKNIQRTTDFTTGGDLFANSLNDELDNQTIFVQQVAETAERGLKAPVTDPTDINMTLPSRTSRIGKVLAFDENGNPIVGEDIGNWRDNWVSATRYSIRDLVKDSTNYNVYRCNTTHTSGGILPISENGDSDKWDLVVDAEYAKDQADAAALSASEAEQSKLDAEQASSDSINLANEFDVVATTLSAGSSATASFNSETFLLSLGIPIGATGVKGDTGSSGRGIVSVVRTSGNGAAGTTDTYTITYTDSTTSTFQVYNGANGTGTGTVSSVAMTVPTGLSISGSPITSSGTLALTLTSGYAIPTTAKQTEWDTAYTDRNKWDGGATGLTASTGRTSLGATTVGSNLFTLTNPSAITFPRLNADNTVSALSASDFKTAIGAVTSVTAGTGLSGGTITTSGTIALANTAVTPGSYSSANITVDAQGRITSASDGTGGVESSFKEPVKCATTGNITLSGTQTIDGVAVIAGDRVLVKSQSSPANNGIYVVASGSWSRSADADSAVKVAGASVAVQDGTVNGGLTFSTSFTSSNTLGGTGMTWNIVITSDVTQTLTNKTISVDNNTISGIAATSFVLSNSSGFIDGSAAQKAIPAGVVVGTSDSQTLTNKTIALGSNTVTGTLSEFNTSVTDADLASLAGTETLTNKRINPRVVAAGSTSGTLTPNGNTTDVFNAFGLTGSITLAAPSGTPVDGQRLMIRLEDNGTGRGITWTTSSGAYRAIGVTLPTTTVATKITYVGCVYNTTDGFWDVIAIATQA